MTQEETVARSHYTLLERLVNALAGLAASAGLSFTQIDRASILQISERKTGLQDWGNAQHLEFLDRLVELVQRDDFTHLSRVVTRQAVIKAASNRLRLVEHLKQNEEVLRGTLGRPIFVLGFPRTGTTLLQNLLCLSPERRALPFWELTNPIPEHEDRVLDRKKRREAAQNLLKLAYRFAPEMRKIHEITADTAEECWYLFFHSFAVLNYDLQTGGPEFGDWLMKSDMNWAYREYRSQLAILNHEWPAENLVLKCPEHLWFLDALMEVFPDAALVWTHRDPVASIASYCSLISLSYRTYFGEIRHKEVGKHIQHRFLQGVTRAMEFRDAINDESRFFDVRFHELVKDPAAMVTRITEHFNLRPVAQEAMANWPNNGRKDKRGAHVYSAERFGLQRTPIEKHFKPYIDRFQVEMES
jgi:hypothetical protein